MLKRWFHQRRPWKKTGQKKGKKRKVEWKIKFCIKEFDDRFYERCARFSKLGLGRPDCSRARSTCISNTRLNDHRLPAGGGGKGNLPVIRATLPPSTAHLVLSRCDKQRRSERVYVAIRDCKTIEVAAVFFTNQLPTNLFFFSFRTNTPVNVTKTISSNICIFVW